MAKSNNSQNKRSLSERDMRLIYILLSLVIIGCSYFFGFKTFQEKKSEVDQENTELQKEVNNLRTMVQNQERVQADTAEKNAKIAKIVSHFPAEIRTQNVISVIDTLEREDRTIKIPSETFVMNQVYYKDGQLLDGEGAATAATSETQTASGTVTSGGTGYVAYRSKVSFSCDTSYNALKKIVNFFNKNDKRMTIDNITISNATGKKTLTCTMTVSMYSISGTEENYEAPRLEKKSALGKNNIFNNR